MSLASAVLRWLSDGRELVYECRDCGTTLDSNETTCPTCGKTEIVEYDVS